MKRTQRALGWLGIAITLVWAESPAPAAACGGFFCSQVPAGAPPGTTPQPIYQAGEKILFSVDPDGTVTAVVQVAYTGPSQSFAWIVPVTSLPEISLGSAELIALVDRQTSPTYGSVMGPTEGVCAPTGTCVPTRGSSGGGCGFAAAGSGAPPRGPYGYADGGVVSDAGARDAGVTVLSRADIGPYDIVVLSGVDALAVARWLNANGYLFPEEALPQIQPYGDAHDDFVAVRLRKDASAGELVPIVLRYTGEPCIPIRLTAVATVPDMPVTAFFLSDVDMRSDNYLETELPDDARLYQGSAATLYTDLLSRAVDDAGGHAFVREYAGTTPTSRVPVPDFTGLAAIHEAPAFTEQVKLRWHLDDATLAVLARALPPPDGVPAETFFGCLAMTGCVVYDDYLRTLSFDPAAAAADLDRELAAPRRSANVMLADHPRLTRLATTLSADEMTLDPTFIRTPVRDVSNIHDAQLVTECSSYYSASYAPVVLRTPAGHDYPFYAGVRGFGTAASCGSPSSSRSFCGCVVPAGGPHFPWLAALAAAAVALGVRRRSRARAT